VLTCPALTGFAAEDPEWFALRSNTVLEYLYWILRARPAGGDRGQTLRGNFILPFVPLCSRVCAERARYFADR
jgi:hypothetical protein